VSTPIGRNGRLAAGESWRRAMEEVARRLADGSTRRYRVRARRIERDWWAYEPIPLSRRLRPEPPLTKYVIAELVRAMPRCAQRAVAHHGGNSKVAWREQGTAQRVAAVTGGRVYECDLPAPAIGQHWHITTSKKRRKR
jgi:hypothetical protein